jgi:hypothetical protein
MAATNRDYLLRFAEIAQTFVRDKHPEQSGTYVKLSVLFADEIELIPWFGQYFKSQPRKNWLEISCNIQVSCTGQHRQLLLFRNSIIEEDQFHQLSGLNDVVAPILPPAPMIVDDNNDDEMLAEGDEGTTGVIGARKAWADMDPDTRAKAARSILPVVKAAVIGLLHENIHDEAGAVIVEVARLVEKKELNMIDKYVRIDEERT